MTVQPFSRFIIRYLAVPAMRKIWLGSVKGFENIPKTGPCIIIANHSSYLDFILLGIIFEKIIRRPLRFWAKTKVVRHPALGVFARFAGCFEVKNRNCHLDLWNQSKAHLRENGCLCIFPEGTRTRTGHIGRFDKGYLKLASETGVPVIPVLIHGAFSVLPPDRILPRLEKCAFSIFPAIRVPARNGSDPLDKINHQIIRRYYVDSKEA